MDIHGHQDAEVFNRSFRRRFWASVDKTSSPTGCWLWMGRIGTGGYGYCFDGVHTANAHRVAWRLAHPHKTLGHAVICHKCDTPACVRPAHLKTGTIRSNNHDATLKGRAAIATDSPIPDEPLPDERREVDRINMIVAQELAPDPAAEPETPQGRAARERAFRERDALVVVLSKLWPSHLMRPAAMDPAFGPDFQWMVCIHAPVPVGTLAWRLNDTSLPHYGHLEPKREIHMGAGVTGKANYAKLALLERQWPDATARKKKGRT